MRVRATRITTKGQVVIPKKFRDGTGLKSGDSVCLVATTENVQIRKRAGWAQTTAGCLPSSLPPLEPKDLDETIDRIAVEETHEKYGMPD